MIKLPFGENVKIGKSKIPCYVMENGTYLLAARRTQDIIFL